MSSANCQEKNIDEASLFIDRNDVLLPRAVSGSGVYLTDDSGKKYLDACSGAIAVNLGHTHPKIIAAFSAQMEKLSFCYRTQFTSDSKITLARKLAELTQYQLRHAYFVGSGSEAVESALKLALQYFWQCGDKKRNRFVSLRPSYHGSTLGALGVTAYLPLETPFEQARIPAINLDAPNYYRKKENNPNEHDENLLQIARKQIAEFGSEQIAAIIVEPVGGASSGGRVLSPKYLQGLRDICNEIGALLIFDEVLSGIGRCGYWFAYEYSKVIPDIITLGKGLGAGYYPMAAIMANQRVGKAIASGSGFMHGHTYVGNPMACATANAVINTIAEDNILANVNLQGKKLKDALELLKEKYPIIGDVRGMGLLYGVEFVVDPKNKTPFPAEKNIFTLIANIAKENGLIIYPRRCLNGVYGDHILICPPLIISENEVDEIINKFDQSLDRLSKELAK